MAVFIRNNTLRTIELGWRPWEKKFAILPRWINKKIVFGTYYERCTWAFPHMNIQRTTSIFEVLKV